ncbi:MAG: glycoside hydrolase family protein [Synechococcaceae cyanobacterium]
MARPTSIVFLPLALAALALPAVAQQVEAMPAAEACATMPRPVVAAIVLAVLVAVVLCLNQVAIQLARSRWSLANALSEVIELRVPVDPAWTASQGDLQASMEDRRAAGEPAGNQNPSLLRVLEPSSSRLIALVGMVVILLMYVGFGLFALYTFGLTCRMPSSTGSVTSFLYSGMALFAPYVANKVSEVFRSLSGTSATPVEPARTSPPIFAASRRPAADESRVSSATAISAATPPATAVATPAAMPAPTHATAAPAPAPALVSSTPAKARTEPLAPEPPAPAGDAYGPAQRMIASFEGFRAQAYPDPLSGGEPWTIGYGFTTWQGHPVVPGLTISRREADAALAEGVKACAAHLGGTIPHWAEMDASQRCALIDFAWNLGQNFYGDQANFATISRDLRERLWDAVPVDLLLYCNPGSSVEAGLRRRRQAEADLWRQGWPRQKGPAAPSAPPAAATTAATATPAATVPNAAAAVPAHANPLPVPWFDQLLMADGEGWRDCFTASSAMLAAYWGKEPNEDAYNRLRERFGDTTSSEAQLDALRSLGLDAHFGTDGSFELLRQEIDAGRPVAVGWLHHGPPSAPSGGGHWTVVIGYDATGVIMNDPYGSCDLVDGGYPQNHDGAHQHYSFQNWGPRWRVNGSGGWYLTCRP